MITLTSMGAGTGASAPISSDEDPVRGGGLDKAESSSSSSSSMRVCNWSFELALAMNFPRESRLLPKPAPMPGGNDGLVAKKTHTHTCIHVKFNYY